MPFVCSEYIAAWKSCSCLAHLNDLIISMSLVVSHWSVCMCIIYLHPLYVAYASQHTLDAIDSLDAFFCVGNRKFDRIHITSEFMHHYRIHVYILAELGYGVHLTNIIRFWVAWCVMWLVLDNIFTTHYWTKV